MPLFDTDGADTHKTTGSGFHFSGAKLSSLGASEYTLVGIACDRSPSVAPFATEIEGCLSSSLEGCQRSPRVDNLLVRLTRFHEELDEVHGFRPLADCHLGSYPGFLKPGGRGTSLHDASTELVDSLATYGKLLSDQDYTVNGLVVILTDGMDNASKFRPKDVKAALDRARMSESLESIVTILIGINVTDPSVGQYLQRFKDEVGFQQYVEAKDASPKTFAKIAGFISRSVSSQSQSVGSKQASQPVSF